MRWWRRLRQRARMERELDTELRDHVDRLVDDNLRAGMSEVEARRCARLAFGGLDQVKEECRDARGTRWAHDVVQDLRFSARLLMNERVLTVTAVVALALGIGVNNTLFAIVNALCIRGLPIERPDRTVDFTARDSSDRPRPLTFTELESLRSGLRSVTGVAAFASAPAAVGDEGRAPDRVVCAFVSSNAFHVIGQQPRLGRDFRDDDDRPGAPPVVVLGSAVWRNRYAADPSVIGRSIRINGSAATVIGVMPDDFKFPDNADLWQPLTPSPMIQPKDARVLGAFARLAGAGSVPQARAEASAIAGRLAQLSPNTNKGMRLTVVPINERYNGDITNPAWLAFITVGALLVVIACSNVANLLLSRSVRRSREMAIRLSLGASRGRLVRQLLAESAILAALGGLAGLGLSAIGLRLFATAIPENGLPFWVTLTMDARVFTMLAVVCLGTVVLFGLAPALHVSRTSANDVLKEGSTTATSGIRVNRWTAVFLTAEFAFTVILLAAVGLSVRSFFASQRPDVVIDTSGLLTTWVTLPAEKYRTPNDRMSLYRGLKERLGGVAAVSSTSLASGLPFGRRSSRHLLIEGRQPVEPAPAVEAASVDACYFETLGLPISRGRPFADTDGTAGHEAAIVNQRFAELFFPDTDPIGQRVQVSADAKPKGDDPWLTIVGVSPNISERRDPPPPPFVYLPFDGAPPATAVLIVRAQRDPGALASLLREEVRALDPNLPLYRIMTLEQVNWESEWNPRLSQRLITVIACIALGLSTLGLCAMTAHGVAQRTREIGIRMALGARPRQVMALVLRRALLQVGAGLIAGAICTAIWGRLFGSNDMIAVGNLLGVAALLTVVAVGACLWPARRAARLDPVIALRQT